MRAIIVAFVLAIAAAGCQRGDESDPDAHGDPSCRPLPYEPAPPAPGAEPVNAPGQIEGRYSVGSRVEDREAAGGFGQSGNYPLDLGGKAWGAAGAVTLVAFPNEAVAHGVNRGFLVRLVNRTGRTVEFEAIDSGLSLVQEARDPDGRWRAIESQPRTSCGNSFHRVFLGPKQYWQVPAREYRGAFTTMLRLRLDCGERPALYSNEFAGSVNLAQFDEISDRGRRNVVKLAVVYDTMAPEDAAPALKNMAESDPRSMEQAAQVLALMQDRKATALLESLNDPQLVGELRERMDFHRMRNEPSRVAPKP